MRSHKSLESLSVALVVNQPLYYNEEQNEYSSDYMNLIDFLFEASHLFEEVSICLPVEKGSGDTAIDLPDNVQIIDLPHYHGAMDLLRSIDKVIPGLVSALQSDPFIEADLIGTIAPSTIGAITVLQTYFVDSRPHFLIMRGDKRQTLSSVADGNPLKRILFGGSVRLYDRLFSHIASNENAILMTIGDLRPIISQYGYNRGDIFPFRPLIPESILIEKPEVDESLSDILYVGRLSEEKGIGGLISAFSILLESDESMHLDIVGSGPAEQKLRDLSVELGLSNSIRFHGFIRPGPQLWEHYDLADVFVLPSHTEGLPRVVGEAMARGLPVVTTAVGGLPNLIEHGENGLLVEPRTVDNFVKHIERLKHDRDLRVCIANMGLETATELTFAAASERFGDVVSDEIL